STTSTGDLPAGDFGDARITAFNSRGVSQGQLANASNQPITIDGLWDLITGPGKSKRTIFFSAGPNGENNGLLGDLTVTTATTGLLTGFTPPAAAYVPPM